MDDAYLVRSKKGLDKLNYTMSSQKTFTCKHHFETDVVCESRIFAFANI